MKKVFFFDVDGTLLPHGNQSEVNPKTIAALNSLQAAGHDVVLATGKAESMIQKEIQALSATNHITMNGAQLVVEDKVMHIERIDQAAIEELKEIARENQLMLGCQTRHEYYMVDIHYDSPVAMQVLNAVSLDVPEVKADFDYNQTISQMWFLGDHSNLDFDGHIIPGHRLLKWHDMGCDIVIEGVTKASAIAKYLDLVYPDTEVETYAFGDGNNDIEMITSVDVGVAMGNGVDALKQVANAVTDSCEDLGVYNYLLQNGFIEG
ncbi:Cof-type HAD-IIB family hydrolase [Mollicutes bacterium LVI A0039]|nr:Cof-type HAD-IIB family hydrolase [Mollicutes bacterium LVI A0039]